MYSVSENYSELATAAAREYNVWFYCSHLVDGNYEQYALYTKDHGIINAKIVNGQTTGGFSIGGTVCASLELTVANNMPFKINDRIWVTISWESPYAQTAGSEALSLGHFYVDSLSANQFSTKIIALDKMAQLAKNYNSALSYPSTVQEMLNEISLQSGVGLFDDIDVFNNAVVGTKPVKAFDELDNEVYYTRREVLGYLAGINGGNAYINNQGKIVFSTPRETGAVINANRVISQTSDGVAFSANKVIISTNGTSDSTDDEYEDGTVQLYIPLDFDDSAAAATQQRLSGVAYESFTLKKQGVGQFELGDLITYKDPDGTFHKILIMGVVYDFSGGFFSETLYSLAKSDSQQRYAGVENISQNISASSGGSGSAETDRLVYVLPWSGEKTELVYDGNSNQVSFLDTEKKEVGRIRISDNQILITGKNTGEYTPQISVYSDSIEVENRNIKARIDSTGRVKVQFKGNASGSKDAYPPIEIISANYDGGVSSIKFGGHTLLARYSSSSGEPPELRFDGRKFAFQ